MTIQLITAQYGEMSVLFQTDGFINATAIAKQFNKQPKEWLRLSSTLEYIEQFIEFQRCENNTFDKNQLVIIKKGSPENGGGTWLHPKLAIPFSRWLDTRFAIWCDLQIEKILFSNISKMDLSGFLKPTIEPITLDDFNWRYLVISQAWQNLKNTTVMMPLSGMQLNKRHQSSTRFFLIP
jgi:KilA-N domain